MTAAPLRGLGLRPVPAHWFELLTFRDDVTAAVESLARTRRVQLDARSETAVAVLLPELQGKLEEYNRLAQRYQAWWPHEALTPSTLPGNPADLFEAALGRLRRWSREAEPLVRETEALQGERSQLVLLREWLEALGESDLRLSLLPAAGPSLAARAFVLPPAAHLSRLPPGVLTSRATTAAHRFIVAVGPAAEVEALEQEVTLQKGRRLPLPPWLREDTATSLAEFDRREAALAGRLDALEARLARLQAEHDLRGALGDVGRLEWFLTNVGELPVTENFAWVTGWCADPEPARLEATLDAAGVRYLLRYTDPPADKQAPMVLRNPAWAQPFELFARAFGTPSATEADPTRLLAFIVPLLFGYMFGDVGQGLVLFATGLLLARRHPGLRLLIPAGLVSALFGLLFGSVFGREDLIPALWLHPMDAPLVVLGVPLLGGVVILVLGQALSGMEAFWRGRFRDWCLVDASQLLLYLALLATLVTPYAALVALAALAWYLGASVALAGGDVRVLGGAAGRLLEASLQLLVNTLSFARVGAFALAHAGLSAAVIALADAAGHPISAAVIMLMGNLVILVIEGLVVSIQITRLMLFEFFIRFLRGEGRRFVPLAAPQEHDPTKNTPKRSTR